MEKGTYKPGSWFAIFLLIYLTAGIFLLWRNRYEGLNANIIGYFMSAYQYAGGNFKDAVNGFWPPMTSWLAAPFIKLGITPLITAKAVNLIAGFFVIIGVRALSYKFDISEGIRNILLAVFVLIVLSYTTIVFTDLLILCFYIFYLNIIFGENYPQRLRSGVYCGILGALAYFSKQYAFPFFFSHFFLMNVFHYFRDTAESARKNIVRNALAGMAVFCVISGLWVATISIKYNYFTLGTVGDYVVRLVGPDNRAVPEFYGPERDDPVYWAGLLKPAYATALSAWDDPSFVSRKLMMDKATLWSDPAYLIKYMLKNVSKILQIVFTKFFSFLSIPVLIAYVLLCLQPLNKLIRRCDILYPFATLLLYSSGLTLFIVHLHNVRYFWLDNVLLLLMAGQVLTLLFRNEFFSSSLRKNVLTVLVALSFIILPAGPILEQKSTRGKRLYALSAELKKTYSMQGNIASDDKWGDTLQVVYDLRNNFNSTVSFYGMPKKNQSSEEILNELKANDIDYYFVWSERLASEGDSGCLPDYKEITEGKISGLKIYSLKFQ